MPARLDTVIVFTTVDLDTMVGFYREVFRLPEFSRHGDVHAGVQLDDVYFGIDHMTDTETDGGATPNAPSDLGTTTWWDVDDVQSAFERAVAAGARVRYPPELKSMGDILASFHDPAGNIVGVVSRSD